jgi:hypothetical protein
VRIVSVRQYRRGRYCRVSVYGCTTTRGYIRLSSNTFEDSSPTSSQSNHTSPSDSERTDPAPINTLSKRKATLPPPGSQRPHKSARTDASHSPGRVATQPWAAKRTQDASGSGTGPASPRKKRKVLLTRNGELLHSLRKLKSDAGTFTLWSPGVNIRLFSDNSRRNNDQSLSRNGGPSSEGKSVSNPRLLSSHKIKLRMDHKLLEYGAQEILRR